VVAGCCSCVDDRAAGASVLREELDLGEQKLALAPVLHALHLAGAASVGQGAVGRLQDAICWQHRSACAQQRPVVDEHLLQVRVGVEER
jgi:hypothetical protein